MGMRQCQLMLPGDWVVMVTGACSAGGVAPGSPRPWLGQAAAHLEEIDLLVARRILLGKIWSGRRTNGHK